MRGKLSFFVVLIIIFSNGCGKIISQECPTCQECAIDAGVPKESIVEKPLTCKTNFDCKGGEHCKDKLCVPIDVNCGKDSDCNNNQLCVFEICRDLPEDDKVGRQCYTYSDCPDGLMCYDNMCRHCTLDLKKYCGEGKSCVKIKIESLWHCL